MIKANRKTPKVREWFRPDQRPTPAPDANEISVTVLLYDKTWDIHGLGWFNFDLDKWNSLEEFYLENEWVWTYAPKPK